jgi:hypothetical protein
VLRVVAEMAADLRDGGAAEWENGTLARFLEAFADRGEQVPPQPRGGAAQPWRPAAAVRAAGPAPALAVAGPSGTGKSHFVEALAHAAIWDREGIIFPWKL